MFIPFFKCYFHCMSRRMLLLLKWCGVRTPLASNRDSETNIAAGGAGKHTTDHLNSKQVCVTLPTWFLDVKWIFCSKRQHVSVVVVAASHVAMRHGDAVSLNSCLRSQVVQELHLSKYFGSYRQAGTDRMPWTPRLFHWIYSFCDWNVPAGAWSFLENRKITHYLLSFLPNCEN